MKALSKSAVFLFVFVLAASTAAVAQVPVADLLNAGRMDDAIRALNAQVSANPKDTEAYVLLSRAYYSLGDFENAIKSGEKAVQLKPDNALYHYDLGKAYGDKADNVGAFSAIGPAKKARQEFERALQLDPRLRRARVALAEFYVEAPGIMGGGRDKASKLAAEIATTDPQTAAWIRALVASKEKKWLDAEKEYKAAITASGNSGTAWLDLARFYARGKRWDDFERAMTSFVSAGKKKPLDLFDAADLLVNTGRNFPLAKQLLDTYLAGGKKDEDGPAFRARYLLGQLYEKSGDKNAATGEYRAALALAQGFRPAKDALKRLGDVASAKN